MDETLLKFWNLLNTGWYPFESGHAQVAYRANSLRTPDQGYDRKKIHLRTSIVKRRGIWWLLEMNHDMNKELIPTGLEEEASRNTKGSLIFFEPTKIKRSTLSTIVAELYALMKCYGTCQMLRGLIKDITRLSSEIHMRTDANNPVTTANTTHVPEQQETIHMIQTLRKNVQVPLLTCHISELNGV